jgi:hypothetical protein
LKKIKIKEYRRLRDYPEIHLQNEAVEWMDKNVDKLVTKPVESIALELYLVSPFDGTRMDLIESYFLNIKFALVHYLTFGSMED